MSTGAGKGGVSQESKDAVHDALFGDDKDDDQAGDDSQSGSQTDDDDDDDSSGDEDGDSSSGSEDQGDDDAAGLKALTEKVRLADRRAARAEAELKKLKDAARGADSGGTNGTSGDKDDKGDGDVDARIAAAKLDAKIEYSEELVATRLEAALEALNVQDASDIVSDLNLGKYVTEDGTVDKDKLKAKIEQFKTTYGRKRRPVGHGNSGGDKNSGVTNADRFAEAIGL